MKSQQNTNTCYVFSQATLDQAMQEWIKAKKKSKPTDHEKYLIVAAAMPWFLQQLNQNPSIFMFSETDLVAELSLWKESQETEYPHQKKLIKNTCNEIINFFQSEIVSNHKMRIEA